MEDDGQKKQIGGILDSLMRSSRFAKSKKTRPVPHGTQLTSFGVPLIEQDDGNFLIDMTAMRVLSGMPGFVSYLAKQFLEQCRNSSADVLTQVMVDSENTPELAALGSTHVVVYARALVARYMVENQEGFDRHLRLVFDAVQTPKWGGLLFPRGFGPQTETATKQDPDEGLALLFPFHITNGGDYRYFALLEYDREGRFLRITLEDATQSRLFLKRIPHRVVQDVGRQHYRQDIATMAEQIFTGIHRECQNQQNEYTEIPGRQPAFFELLIAAGLEEIAGAVFRWTQETAEKLLLESHAGFMRLLSKILVLLEDDSIIKAISAGDMIEMVEGPDRVYFDLSRKGAMLNISIGRRRQQPDMNVHLKRMPLLFKSVTEGRPASLQDYRILLIQHTTSEVLGFVKAMEAVRCASMTTLFIRYQGIVPGFHLEDMLSMPDNQFRFYALQRVELRDSVDGAYILSRQYSPLKGLEDLDEALRLRRGDYINSMRLTAMHLFFREAFTARQEGRKLLLIEDGGYVAPVLNRFCHDGKRLADALDFCALPPPRGIAADVPLEAWLEEILPATFEHTANGYYQLREVEEEYGRLIFPAFTIAVSKYKNIIEAEACAYSIISAIESIFNGLGKCFMHRHALILGSSGNIGHYLLRTLAARVTYGSAHGLDIKERCGPPTGFSEYLDIDALPEEEWKRLDLIIGVTGVSVLKRHFFEKLILKGTAHDLFFASGSTKTIEFSDLTSWVEELSTSLRPSIGGHPVRIERDAIKDPQNRVLQGHHIRIVFEDSTDMLGISPNTRHKDLYILGDSMPINFLYYGVPGEIIDGVFEELFSLVSGFVAKHEEGIDYPPDIYAIDVNINKHASIMAQEREQDNFHR